MSELKGRDLLSMADLSRQEIGDILRTAGELKRRFSERKLEPILANKVIGLLFEKASTRTRASFEAAVAQLGGTAMYLRSDELQLRRGEPIKDTARVLGSYLDGLVIRTYEHETLQEFAAHSDIPIVNALSNLEHPTQIVCDMFTITEVKGSLEDLTLAWIGDGNNVCNSWLLGGSAVGMDLVIACPKGYEPDKSILQRAQEICLETGGAIRIVRSPKEAASKASILYTDVWISMGQEKEAKKREQAFRGYRIDSALLRHAPGDALIMHCLPAHRGMEITDEVLEGPRSIVWRQAENKLHGARGILASLI